MKNCAVVAAFSALLFAPKLANAQEPPPPPPASPPTAPPPAADRPAAEPTKPALPQGISPGFQLEAGAATTHVSHGVGKYATKTTPSTEDVALFRLRGIGPGTFAIGSAFSAALSTATQPPNSVEYVPQITYGGSFGFLDATAGFQLKVQPRQPQGQIDNAYEGILRLSVPNGYLTPTLEFQPELVQKRGVYIIAGAEHSFHPTKWLLVKPRVAIGEQGYDAKSERLHTQDLTASIQVKAQIDDTFYAVLRPAYSLLAGPSHYYKDPSFAGRSLPYITFAIGAQR